MVRKARLNLLLGVAIGIAVIYWMLGDTHQADEAALVAGDRIARIRPTLEIVVDIVDRGLLVAQIVLLMAIATVVYLILVRSGRLHAPWVAAHIVEPLDRWRRRREAAAKGATATGQDADPQGAVPGHPGEPPTPAPDPQKSTTGSPVRDPTRSP